MEFGLDQLRTGLQPGSSRFCSNLVADRFEAKFHYTNLVADLQGAGIWPVTPYLAR